MFKKKRQICKVQKSIETMRSYDMPRETFITKLPIHKSKLKQLTLLIAA